MRTLGFLLCFALLVIVSQSVARQSVARVSHHQLASKLRSKLSAKVDKVRSKLSAKGGEPQDDNGGDSSVDDNYDDNEGLYSKSYGSSWAKVKDFSSPARYLFDHNAIDDLTKEELLQVTGPAHQSLGFEALKDKPEEMKAKLKELAAPMMKVMEKYWAAMPEIEELNKATFKDKMMEVRVGISRVLKKDPFTWASGCQYLRDVEPAELASREVQTEVCAAFDAVKAGNQAEGREVEDELKQLCQEQNRSRLRNYFQEREKSTGSWEICTRTDMKEDEFDIFEMYHEDKYGIMAFVPPGYKAKWKWPDSLDREETRVVTQGQVKPRKIPREESSSSAEEQGASFIQTVLRAKRGGVGGGLANVGIGAMDWTDANGGWEGSMGFIFTQPGGGNQAVATARHNLIDGVNIGTNYEWYHGRRRLLASHFASSLAANNRYPGQFAYQMGLDIGWSQMDNAQVGLQCRARDGYLVGQNRVYNMPLVVQALQVAVWHAVTLFGVNPAGSVNNAEHRKHGVTIAWSPVIIWPGLNGANILGGGGLNPHIALVGQYLTQGNPFCPAGNCIATSGNSGSGIMTRPVFAHRQVSSVLYAGNGRQLDSSYAISLPAQQAMDWITWNIRHGVAALAPFFNTVFGTRIRWPTVC